MRERRYVGWLFGGLLSILLLCGGVTVRAESTVSGTAAGTELHTEAEEMEEQAAESRAAAEEGSTEAAEEAEEDSREATEETGQAVPEIRETTEEGTEMAEASASGTVEGMSTEAGDKTGITYRVHVQTYGWQNFTAAGETAGTTGQSKRLEAIEIKLTDQAYEGEIQYRTHIQTYGWEEAWTSNGSRSGTTGQSKRLEAIEIQLTGEIAEHYDVYYRVHAQDYGWLGWARNGDRAGTTGQSKRLEAIEIRLIQKGQAAPGSMDGAYKHPLVQYETHVQSYGWQPKKSDGAMNGTTGQSKRLEGICITLPEQEYSGEIRYRSHVQDYGWQDFVSNGAMSGTEGQSKRLEAIEIQLTGEMAEHYDIYYRVHCQTFGWLDWASNGEPAGSEGLSKRLEGIEILLTAKGGRAPGDTSNAFIDETDRLVVIDAGHQARANLEKEPVGPGAYEMKYKVSGGTAGRTTGIPEYQVVLDVSMRLKEELEKRGCVVIMVRTTHDVNISNSERAQIANRNKADAFVRIHCNGSSDISANGAMTICMTPYSPYCSQIYADSRKLSEEVLNHLCQATGARREYVWETDTMSGINWCQVPVTIVEMGYMSNPAEEQQLISADYQAKLAVGIANGIEAYLNFKD